MVTQIIGWASFIMPNSILYVKYLNMMMLTLLIDLLNTLKRCLRMQSFQISCWILKPDKNHIEARGLINLVKSVL
jgi:hypothetical protein